MSNLKSGKWLESAKIQIGERNKMIEQSFKSAAFSEDFTYVIDACSNKIKTDDRRVVFIWPLTNNSTPFVKSIHEKKGWRIRLCKPYTHEILHNVKKLSSGRECLSFNFLAGIYYTDIMENYDKDDILVYWGIEQEGPCQCGAWPDVWKVLTERLGISNAIYSVNLTLKNNYLGQGMMFGRQVLSAIILGDLFDEAECTLRCLALNKEEALKIFNKEMMKVVSNFHKGILAIERSLKEWANNIRKIPLKATVEETPKILIFGGGVLPFIKEPINEYCYQQGVIPKIVEFHEFLLTIFSEYARRYGFKRGYDNLDQHLDWGSLIMSLFNSQLNLRELKLAMSSRLTLDLANFLNHRFRKALQGSGLLFDKHVSLASLLKDGHQFINPNIFNEADIPVGKYLKTMQTGVFDGLVHVAVFTCQNSINAQAVIRALAHRYDIPFVGLELEGPWLSTNHHRLLENVTVQARRLREANNAV
ncbi:hypothetical protein [Methylomusa anaerophila]|nr:hypothetical protein [Methylomusa anaerophila]